jgi:hypothetical protein
VLACRHFHRVSEVTLRGLDCQTDVSRGLSACWFLILSSTGSVRLRVCPPYKRGGPSGPGLTRWCFQRFRWPDDSQSSITQGVLACRHFHRVSGVTLRGLDCQTDVSQVAFTLPVLNTLEYRAFSLAIEPQVHERMTLRSQGLQVIAPSGATNLLALIPGLTLLYLFAGMACFFRG